MDYSSILSQLEDASLFDLYRLRAAMQNEMDNPERIAKVKRQMRVGQTVQYFDAEDNRLVEVTVEAIKRTRVHVKEVKTGQRWTLPFYMVNMENVTTDIHQSKKALGMSRNEIRVGDYVGFFSERKNQNIHGRVIRLNSKTVTLSVEPDQEWRVSYSMIYPIVDAEHTHQRRFIEGTVVDPKPDIQGFLFSADSK
jgi:hypothetical protein